MTTALNFGLRRAAARLTPDSAPDGELLSRFLASRDEAAFALLVRRHAGMVFGTCRRVLGNAPDADDAFQAAFVVLVRKAHSLTGRACVGNFLYGVAFHTALKARAMATKRRVKEAKATRSESAGSSELTRVLDEELSKLPDKYREPVVLCELDGVSRKDAAARLGVPEGTISSRLATAHRMLAKRLAARGFAAVAVAAVLGNQAFAVPDGLAEAAVRAAADGPPAGVTQLATEVSKMLLWNKLKAGVVLTGVLLMCGIGFGMATKGFADDKPAVKAPVPAKEAKKADDAKLLQGKWTTKAVTFDPPFPVPPGAKHTPAQHVLTFTDKELTWVTFTPDDVKIRSEQTKPYKLDQTTSPKELTSGDMECVYEVDGDTLKVAMYFLTPGRPKGFNAKDSPPGKGHVILIELTREKEEPKKEEKLLGKWKQSGMSAGGVKVDLGEGERHWVIGEDQIQSTTTNPLKHGSTFRYVSSADRTPSELTTTNEQGEKRHNIYKLDGDTLTVAFFVGSDPKNPPAAPKGFTEKDVGAEAFKTLYLVTYERVKEEKKPEADKSYSLKDDEVLKLIAAPFPEERDGVFLQVNRRRSAAGGPKGYRMVIPADGTDLRQCFLSSSAENGWPLGFALASVLGIDQMEITADTKVLAAMCDADALVRPDTPAEKLLPALQAELKAKCGIDVTLEFQQVEREVVVASGTYLKRAGPNQVEPRHEYTLDADEPKGKPNWGAHVFNAGFLPAIGSYVGRPVIDESNLKVLPNIQFSLNEFHHTKPDDPAFKAPDPETVLKRLADQTGLTFKLEKRKVRTLVVAKADKPEADKSYSLKDGEVLKLIPAPFPKEREEVVRLHKDFKHLGISDQFLLSFTFENGKSVAVGGGMSRGTRSGEVGMRLSDLFTYYLQYDLTPLSDPDWLLQSSRVDCDVLLKKGTTPVEWLPALQKELKAKCGVDLMLEFREAETEVIVIRGKHTFKPMPIDALARKLKPSVVTVFTSDKRQQVIGQGDGTSRQLPGFLAQFLGRPVVDESDLVTNEVALEVGSQVIQHSTRKGALMEGTPEAVFADMEKQTGLTFKLEKRKVMALVVAKADPNRKSEGDQKAPDTIEGTWAATVWEQQGVAQADGMKKLLAEGGFQITFAAGTMTYGFDRSSLKYTLEPLRDPKQVQLRTPGGGIALGIYELKGDELKLCIGRTELQNGKKAPVAPSGFDTESLPPGANLFVMKRVTKKPDDPKAKPPEKKDEPAWKAEFDKLYTLADGEVVKYVHATTPAAKATREAYYRDVVARGRKDAKPDVGTVIIFRYGQDGTKWANVGGSEDSVNGKHGMSLYHVLAHMMPADGLYALGFDLDLSDVYLPGDWVVRDTSTTAERVKAIQKVLTDECKVPVKLELAEEEKNVLVASGEWKFTPREWRKERVDVYALEKAVDKQSYDGDGWQKAGGLNAFLREVGGFCDRRIVAGEVKSAPSSIIWRFHSRYSANAAETREDHDADAILKNVSEQTGLTFKAEKRKVPVLAVTKQ